MYISDEQKCHAIIHTASASAAGVGAGLAQIPFSDNAVIVPIQITMVISLGAVFNVELSKSAATAILSTVGTSMIGRGVSQALLGWIPGVGNAINASTAAAVTEAAGWATVRYFENLSEEDRRKYNEGKKEGFTEASEKYEDKLKKQARFFEEQKVLLKKDFESLKELIKEYEKYIEEKEAELANLSKEQIRELDEMKIDYKNLLELQ